MIIDCISDLHGEFPELPGGDLLIVAGDLTSSDEYIPYTDVFEWLCGQEYKMKIVIAGNHDNKMQNDLDFDFPEENIVHLEDSGIEFEGLKIWGTPWSLHFDGVNPHCTAFMGNEEDLDKKYQMIPNDTDILISHSPMKYMLDQSIRSGVNCGSWSLRKAVDRVKPKLFVCGHIHEHGGKTLLYKHEGKNTICVNASLMNENYEFVYEPMRVVL